MASFSRIEKLSYAAPSSLVLFCVAVGVALMGAAGEARAGTVVPTDGMVIIEDTTFEPGTYNLPNGVSIGASGVTLDMNGAVLVGTNFANYGVTSIGHSAVTIMNGVVENYYYGMRMEDGTSIQILGNNLSDNWVDPNSMEAPAPFLNINVGPNLGDTTNLGGGLFMRDVSGATVSGNVLRHQENGIDLYFVTGSTIENNDASNNTGWGIHLHGSTGNTVAGNTADHCTRPGLGDSAGFLVVVASNDNQFLNNSFQFGGDGFFIGNEHGCPSNGNLVQGNDGSSAGANAFEATFSSGNQFIDNIANGSDSSLLEYDIATDTWSATPTLQASGVIPGFRSGAMDIWGVTITSDPVRNRLFVNGGEANRQVYVFDIASQAWTATPTAVYDGGWGDGLEYVSGSDRLYQIDGRNATGAPQGTAVLAEACLDFDGDGTVGAFDLAIVLGGWGECEDSCCPTDFDENGQTAAFDLAVLLGAWGPCE